MDTLSSPAIGLELLARLTDSREETDRLFSILTPSALYERPIPERHRISFYIGHLEAFDWNLLREHLQLDHFHPDFDRLFAFGIDPVDGGLPADQPGDWPSRDEISHYRRRVRNELDAALRNATESETLIQLLNISIEHRLMHAETLEYMFHQLPFDAKIPPFARIADQPGRGTPELMKIPAGAALLGLDRDSDQFGWDNEFEAHVVSVPAFAIDKYKITNGQFAQFVEAGGYNEPSFWSPSDWEWKCQAEISQPVFWISARDGFRYRTMFEEIPLPLQQPVYVSHAEALAYAHWAGKDLPTEAEWQRAAEGAKPPRDTRAGWEAPGVGSSPELASAFGVEDLLGTGWEWTSTVFGPFTGFRASAAYPGYSANFFDGQHFVMKGGSMRTAACMLRKSFRNWFQAHYQYVYAGFRCVTR